MAGDFHIFIFKNKKSTTITNRIYVLQRKFWNVGLHSGLGKFKQHLLRSAGLEKDQLQTTYFVIYFGGFVGFAKPTTSQLTPAGSNPPPPVSTLSVGLHLIDGHGV